MPIHVWFRSVCFYGASPVALTEKPWPLSPSPRIEVAHPCFEPTWSSEAPWEIDPKMASSPNTVGFRRLFISWFLSLFGLSTHEASLKSPTRSGFGPLHHPPPPPRLPRRTTSVNDTFGRKRLWHIWMNCACAMNKRSPLVRSDIVCPLPLSLNPPPVPTVPGEDDGPGEPTGRDVCAAGWRRGCGRGFQRQGHIRLHAQRLHCARLQHSPWHRCTHTSHISIDRQVKCIL